MDSTNRIDRQTAEGAGAARHCAFCRRDLDAGFSYCPYCGVRLRTAGRGGTRWYYSRTAVMMGLATVGPFALPLVWFNPRYTAIEKIVLTVIILALTAVILYALIVVYRQLAEQLGEIMSVY